jgi:hypothetical protein
LAASGLAGTETSAAKLGTTLETTAIVMNKNPPTTPIRDSTCFMKTSTFAASITALVRAAYDLPMFSIRLPRPSGIPRYL